MYKNNSKDKPYYTQRNNRIKPGTSCGGGSIRQARYRLTSGTTCLPMAATGGSALTALNAIR